jgi:hypothetical protein
MSPRKITRSWNDTGRAVNDIQARAATIPFCIDFFFFSFQRRFGWRCRPWRRTFFACFPSLIVAFVTNIHTCNIYMGHTRHVFEPCQYSVPIEKNIRKRRTIQNAKFSNLATLCDWSETRYPNHRGGDNSGVPHRLIRNGNG